MKLHRFNPAGLERFGQFLDALALDPATALPDGLLTDPAGAIAVSPGVEVETRAFANRMDAAAYLDGVLARVTGCDIQRDAGLWAWLTLFYFDCVCPRDGHGRRKVGERARYVPRIDASRRFYRHALLGPYLAYRSHRDDSSRASVLLSDPMHVTTGEAYRLFIETPFINMPAPVEVATRFYYNPSTGKLRRGAGVKGAGGVRRLVAVLQQLDVTFDIHELGPRELVRLLPGEFGKWSSYSPELW